MKKLRAVLLPLCLLSISGCTWQSIPAIPEYAKEQSIPLRVGVVATGTPASLTYVAAVVKELKSMQLFDTITYPYRDGDPVDAVSTISVEGEWIGSGAGAGFVIGLTLGLASPFLGPEMTGTHDIKAEFVSDKKDIGSFTAQTSSTVNWGLMADTNSVTQRAEELQIKRLSNVLASKIRSDRQILLAKVKSAR